MKIKKGDHLVFTYIANPEVKIVVLCLDVYCTVPTRIYTTIEARTMMTHPKFADSEWVGKTRKYFQDNHTGLLEYNREDWSVRVISAGK